MNRHPLHWRTLPAHDHAARTARRWQIAIATLVIASGAYGWATWLHFIQ